MSNQTLEETLANLKFFNKIMGSSSVESRHAKVNPLIGQT